MTHVIGGPYDGLEWNRDEDRVTTHGNVGNPTGAQLTDYRLRKWQRPDGTMQAAYVIASLSDEAAEAQMRKRFGEE
jgi:hypothetical protein